MPINKNVNMKDIKVEFVEFPETIFYRKNKKDCIRYKVTNITREYMRVRVFLIIGDKKIYGKWHYLRAGDSYYEKVCFSSLDLKVGEQSVSVFYEKE